VSAAAHPPALLRLAFEHWQPAWTLDGALACCCALYLYGAWRVKGWRAIRTGSFLAGVAVVALALQSGIAAYDERLLSAHMIQHMLLLLPAPLLLLEGRPLTLALRAAGPPQRRSLARLLIGARPLGNPFFCVAVFSAVLLASHLPAIFDQTLRHPLAHEAEHALFILIGLLFWSPLLDADPTAARRLGALGRLVYMLAAMPAMALLGAYLNRAASVVYAPYAPAARALGVSAVSDQQQAGAIMWVGGSMLLVVVGLWVVMSTMSAEERRQTAREQRELMREQGTRAGAGAGP
jgi:cytochrome c oxidase assembly factor CtaG